MWFSTDAGANLKAAICVDGFKTISLLSQDMEFNNNLALNIHKTQLRTYYYSN